MAYSVWQKFITDGGEQVVPGALISVFFESSGLPAPIYDGPSGSTTGNTTSSDITGLARFYVPAGTYRITASKGSFSATFRDVQLGNMSATDDAPIDSILYARLNGGWEPFSSFALTYEQIKSITVGSAIGSDYPSMESAMDEISTRFSGQALLVTLTSNINAVSPNTAISFPTYVLAEIELNGFSIGSNFAIISGGTNFLAIGGSGTISGSPIIMNGIAPIFSSPANITINGAVKLKNFLADSITFTNGGGGSLVLHGGVNLSTVNLIGISSVTNASGSNNFGNTAITLTAAISEYFYANAGGTLGVASLSISGAFAVSILYNVIDGFIYGPTPSTSGGASVTNLVNNYTAARGIFFNGVGPGIFLRFDSDQQGLSILEQTNAIKNIGIAASGPISNTVECFTDFGTSNEGGFASNGTFIAYTPTGSETSASYGGGSTGASATGTGGVRTGVTIFNTSNGDLYFAMGDTFVSALSTGSETYTCVAGFIDVNSGPSVDGAYFLYQQSTSVNWQCVTVAGGVSTGTVTTTSVPVKTTAGDKLEVRINGSQTKFWINNVLVATHNANAPSGWSQAFGAGMGILKSAGTTARLFIADWMRAKQTLNTPRNMTQSS